MSRKTRLVAVNDLLPFRGGGTMSKKDLPHIKPGRIPEKFITTKTKSRVADEVPVMGNKKVNAYNYRKGKPYTKFGKFVRKLKSRQDGGSLENDGVTFAPSDVQEKLPGLTQDQLADLIMQASQNREGVVSDTIQFKAPPMTDPNQLRTPLQFTTPSQEFDIEGINLNAPPAGKKVAPILPQRQGGGTVAQDTTNPNRFAPNIPMETGRPALADLGELDLAMQHPNLLGESQYDPSEYEAFMRENFVPFSDHPNAQTVNGEVPPKKKKLPLSAGGAGFRSGGRMRKGCGGKIKMTK